MIRVPTTRRGFLRALAASAAPPPVLTRAREVEGALISRVGGFVFEPTSRASVRALRGQYLLAPDLIYMNHASIGTAPRAVVEAHAGTGSNRRHS